MIVDDIFKHLSKHQVIAALLTDSEIWQNLKPLMKSAL